MSAELNYGPLTPDAIGVVLKEAARRATEVIYNERFIFQAHVKEGYSGAMDDVFTSADTKAQDEYLRVFRGCLPGFGVIAEEDKLRWEPTNGLGMYLTVDPLDGTKAYTRKQSHGIGTMVSLVTKDRFLGGFVGDVMTNELYYTRPGSENVWRISRLNMRERLDYLGGDKLSQSYALLRDPPGRYCDLTRRSLGAFKNYESSGGSIGIWLARLWKREAAAAILPAGTETPWDSNPIMAISKKLGYLFFRPGKCMPPNDIEDGWVQYEPTPIMEVTKRSHDTLIIHKDDCLQLGDCMTL